MKRFIALISMALSLTCVFSFQYSQASDTNTEIENAFYELCGQTATAESLSIEELSKMVEQCDMLKEKINQSTHPKKKVFLFRLDKCRNFLDFMIQTKQLESSKQ